MGRGSESLAAVMAALVVVVPATADAALPVEPAAPATGRILVGLRPGAEPAAVAASAAVRLAGPQIPQIGVMTVRPDDAVDRVVALRRLRRDARVRYAVAEGRHTLRAAPDDPALNEIEPHSGDTQALSLQWALGRHGFPRAWQTTRGGGAVVAVLDTGVDGEHPDLEGKVADAVDLDDASDTPPTTDEDGHGTHVASLACAATDNGLGMAGAGHDCRLLVIRSDLTDASIVKGIVTAADRGTHALNMSFGDDGSAPSPALADALTYAAAHGVVLVAAAADEPVEEQGEPANLLQPTGTGPDIAAGLGLTVTAAGSDDRRASFAGHGTQVSLAAYGALRADKGTARGLFGLYPEDPTPRESPTVVPPHPGCGCRTTFEGDVRYAFLAGTSMAAPHVAAAAALLRDLNPDLRVDEVVRLLKQTARRPHGEWTPDLGWGILDAGAAVEAARRIDRVPPASRPSLPRRLVRGALELRWHGRDRARRTLLPAGVLRYELWMSIDGAPARRVAVTRGTRRRVRVRRGHRYALHTIAIDAAGNREPAPARPDLVVQVERSGLYATRGA